MRKALQNHWPEYLMEAAELAIFMISASLFTILLYHPATPAVRAIPFSTCMHRADAATVSYTEVAVSLSQVNMRYHAEAMCRHATPHSVFCDLHAGRRGSVATDGNKTSHLPQLLNHYSPNSWENS